MSGEETPSFIGLAERVMASGGLSKAYALPGLRIGWLVGPPDEIESSWSYHDYTSIAAGVLSNRIAEWVLAPALRAEVLERNRTLLRNNLEMLLQWVDGFGSHFYFVPPRAGGLAFIRYDFEINSSALSTWLREEEDVFILAGDTFGMDGFFRIGIGAEPSVLRRGLATVGAALRRRFES
jgi:aspartate/methionine/tyrosine aminotransferase